MATVGKKTVPPARAAPGWPVLAVLAMLALAGSALVVGAVLLSVGVLMLRSSQLTTAAEVSSFAVAGATLLLAALTGGLAVFTFQAVKSGVRQELIAADALDAARNQAEVSERQAETAAEALKASWRPLLVDVPRVVSSYPDDPGLVSVAVTSNSRDLELSVPFRNVGSGAAILLGIGVKIGERSGPTGSMSASILPRGETTRVVFALANKDFAEVIEPLLNGSPFEVSVSYTDQVGVGRWRSVAHADSYPDGIRFVRQVALFEGDSETPFAMSGPTSVL